MTEASHQETDNASSGAEPVSLAVAADVARIRLEDSPHQHSPHAMGQATAQRLKSLLSHISPPITKSLASELNPPTKSTSYPSSENVDGNVVEKNVNGVENIEASDEEEIVERSLPKIPSQSQQHHAENGFKRFLHQVDNFFHLPANARHHQGHRFNSVLSNETTTHHSDVNTACAGCAYPVCTIPSANICNNNEQKKDTDQPQSQPQAQQQSQQQKSRRHLPLFHTSRRLSSFKTRFQMPFHSSTAAQELSESQQQEQKERTLRHQYRGVLLSGTTTWEQHEAKVKSILHICELYQLGYDLKEYSQKENDDNTTDDSLHDVVTTDNNSVAPTTVFETRARRTLSSIGFEFRLDKCNDCTENNTMDDCCERCITRLYYTPSNTAITNENRREFIADGKMYDAIADLCQSAAQEIMAEACDLVWVTVCDGKGGGLSARLDEQSSNLSSESKSIREWPRDDEGNIIVLEPIRALVGRCKSKSGNGNQSKDTFLVSTGKGKVSAGIFSRQHLLTTGLEPSTALPLLREARSRGMNCVVIDPNARGDRVGMDTFQVSVRSLFQQECSAEVEDAIIPAASDGYIYVLAHSAAGGQLVRYLLDKNQGTLLPRIRSITFTDSTHSVQWLKEHPHISSLIQSSKALYVRSANPMRDDGWENAKPGDECAKDHFWSHRFGQIKTVWAGTTDHSLTNWAARAPIWEHFDKNAGDKAETSSSHTDLHTN
jgi:hypothetical protein